MCSHRNIEELGTEENEADEQALEISADVDETENPVFGTSPESFTEAPESAQHYA